MSDDQDPRSAKTTPTQQDGLLWLPVKLSSIVLAVMVAAEVIQSFFAHPRMGLHQSCITGVKQMALGTQMYANDYDNRLPVSAAWMDSIYPYTRTEGWFHDPSGVQPGEYGYAFRDKASGLKTAHVDEPESYALVFDSKLLQRNAHSEPSSMPRPGRHGGHDMVGYLDGHVKSLPMP